jgi:hypothetical protein
MRCNNVITIRTYNLHLLPCRLIFLGCLVPGILLQKYRQDLPHLIRVGPAWIDDRANPSNHSAIEHPERSCNQVIIGNHSFDILPVVCQHLDTSVVLIAYLNSKSSFAASKHAVRDWAYRLLDSLRSSQGRYPGQYTRSGALEAITHVKYDSRHMYFAQE